MSTAPHPDEPVLLATLTLQGDDAPPMAFEVHTLPWLVDIANEQSVGVTILQGSGGSVVFEICDGTDAAPLRVAVSQGNIMIHARDD